MTYSTFPLRAFSAEHGCNCSKGLECPTIGKHPACDWKTSSEAYECVMTGGMGIRTGEPSGIWVLDVDLRPEKGVDGVDTLAEMGTLPTTRIVASPSGGLHYYFLLPDFPVLCSAGKLGPGLDIRGEGGMVVAPGSPHKRGGYYQVECEGPVAAAPEWLLERVRALSTPKPQDATGKVVPISKDHKEYPRRLELAREHCLTAPPAIEGQDGSGQTMSVAHHLTVKLELSIDVAYGLMLQHYNPRCIPEPWTPKLLYKKVVDAAQNNVGTMTGVAPDGWSLKSPPKEFQRVDEDAPIERRVYNPSHQYTFTVGDASNGKAYKATLAQVVSALVYGSEEWAGVFQYDEFGDKIIAVNPPVQLAAEQVSITDSDVSVVQCWFEVQADMLVGKDMMMAAIEMAAKKLTFNPVKDYLEALPKVEDGYLDVFARYMFGNIQPIQVEFIKMALVSAIKRIYEPGCFVKSMLILYGSQDAGKSSFCKKLFGKWFKEDISDLKSKDAMQELQGVWGLEMAEMDSISRAEIKTSKSFISKAVDRYRPSYGRCMVERPRRCIFIGTTNEREFLRDSTGSSRYHPIEVPDDMPTEWDRDEVWSAAYQLYLSGYTSYLATTEQVQAAEEVRKDHDWQDPWTTKVEQAVMGKTKVTAMQVAALLIQDMHQLNGQALSRIQGILKKMAGSSRRVGQADRSRYYIIPPSLSSMKSSSGHLDKLKPS